MSSKTKRENTSEEPQSPEAQEFPFKNGIGLIQSCLVLIACIGLLEVGFLYTTVLVYVLMTIMFHEMLQVQVR